MNTKIICPNCQNETHSMALACPKCHHPLIKNDEQEHLPANNNSWEKAKVLFQPRLAAKYFVPQISNRQALFWIGLAGATAVMADAIEPIIGEKARFVDIQSIGKSAVLAISLGALSSIVGVYILSYLIQWIGKRLDVITTAKEIRALFAWSTPPVFLWAATLLSEWFVYFPDYFQTNQFLQHTPGELGLWWATSGINAITILCLLWFILFLVIGLTEIGNSLIWSSLATLTLSGLTISGFLMIILYIQTIRILRSF
jgi:hypothetical protein